MAPRLALAENIPNRELLHLLLSHGRMTVAEGLARDAAWRGIIDVPPLAGEVRVDVVANEHECTSGAW